MLLVWKNWILLTAWLALCVFKLCFFLLPGTPFLFLVHLQNFCAPWKTPTFRVSLPPGGSSLPSFVPPLSLYYSTCRINDTCFLTGLWASLSKGNVSVCTECPVPLMLVWPEWEGLSAVTRSGIMPACLTVLWVEGSWHCAVTSTGLSQEAG